MFHDSKWVARRLFGDTAPTATPTADEQRKLLLSFATRAFRRPVTAEEIEPYAAIITAQLQRGIGFTEAMLAGYKAVLCAPDFLLIGLEQNDGKQNDVLKKPKSQMILSPMILSKKIGDFAFLINQRLAELYGIHGVNGAELRAVKLPEGSPRGGFLTQAAVLKVSM